MDGPLEVRPLHGQQLLPAGRVPDTNGPVARVTQQPRAVGAELQLTDRPFMTAKNRPLACRSDVVQDDGEFAAARDVCERLTVRTEPEPRRVLSYFPERRDLSAGAQVVQPDLRVGGMDGHEAAVGRDVEKPAAVGLAEDVLGRVESVVEVTPFPVAVLRRGGVQGTS